MSQLVSIITPAYNAGSYLRETVDTVLKQTYPHWELIIVDDGSTDNTKEIAGQLVGTDNRIHYIYQPNGRQGKARNNGLRKAQGSYIAFLDADDLWLPEKLALQVQYMESHPAVDLVFSDAYIFSSGPLTGEEKNIGIQPTSYAGEDGLKAFLAKNRVPILTALARKSSIDRVSGFNEAREIQNAEDYMLWCEMLINGSRLDSIPDVVAAYRKHEQSVTASSDGSAIKQVIEVQYQLIKKYPVYESVIRPQLKAKLINSLSVIGREPDKQYCDSVKRLFHIGGLKMFNGLHNLFGIMGMRKLALKMAYFLINRINP